MSHRLLCGFLIWVAAAPNSFGQTAAAQSDPDWVAHYQAQVQPLLKTKCFACHSGLKQQAGLRLDSRAYMQTGGDSGSAIEGAEASLLMQRVTAQDDTRMPPPTEGSALTSDEIAKLAGWLRAGAVAPADEVPLIPEQHWAFQPIDTDSALAKAADAGAVAQQAGQSTHPIDALVSKQRLARTLPAARPVERHRLLRRLYLDLIGLLPTPEQVADARPVEEIVDELLATPLYGQRWGRHWMDIWRYTDWYGLGDQLRNSQKHLWHWRDWIVDSLNADKGYDRMILEMLAGDELAPEDQQAIAGTGFLARNYYLFNRTTWLDDTIEHTGKAFLGLTLNCCKCHDHKYDPLTQQDYYNFRAIFEPHQVRLDPLPGTADLELDGLPRVFDDHLDAKTYLHRRGDPAQPDSETSIQPQIPAHFGSAQLTIRSVDLPLAAYAPGTRQEVRHTHMLAARARRQQAEQQVAQARAALAEQASDSPEAVQQASAVTIAAARLAVCDQALISLQATIAADDVRFGLIASDSNALRQAAREQLRLQLAEAQLQLLEAGDKEDQKKAASHKIEQLQQQLADEQSLEQHFLSLKVSRKALETPEHTDRDYPADYSPISTGRRLALARWIASPENPLTARVAVNHIWLRHFGQPLVENVFDFGLRTQPPAQLELLDYLSAQFMQSGWSVKSLHRLLVTSQLYALGDEHYSRDSAAQTADSSNIYWWRGNVRRMEAQVVRDNLLYLAGQLDTSLGGPPQPLGPDSRRRSLYLKHSLDDRDLFLSMFDDADLLQCYRRSESIVPQQALALANSRLSMEMSVHIAKQITDRLETSEVRLADSSEYEFGDNAPNHCLATVAADASQQFVDRAFWTILGRPASSGEAQLALQFIQAFCHQSDGESSSDAVQRAQIRLVHSLLNHNDFIAIR
ncbi:MAG: PSD1 domain-containing protein [Pirellulaceae bacterium]|nr:PSD1 domain-containing protein [Pirellulaceae bacterium]